MFCTINASRRPLQQLIHCLLKTKSLCVMFLRECRIHTIVLLFAENKVLPAYSSSHGSSGSSSASASTSQHPPSLPPNHPQHGPPVENSNANNGGNGVVLPHPSRLRHSSSVSSSSGFTSISQQQHPPAFPPLPPDRISIHSGRSGGLGVAAHLANSRESFQQALDNPCNEYFIDVM